MTTGKFITLLQNELILPRDPHTADRFSALLEEHYVPLVSEPDVQPVELANLGMFVGADLGHTSTHAGIDRTSTQTREEISAQSDILTGKVEAPSDDNGDSTPATSTVETTESEAQ